MELETFSWWNDRATPDHMQLVFARLATCHNAGSLSFFEHAMAQVIVGCYQPSGRPVLFRRRDIQSEMLCQEGPLVGDFFNHHGSWFA